MGKAVGGLFDVVGSLMGGNDKPDTPAAPAPMPDDARIAAAKRRSIATERAAGGTMSTLLSGGTGEKLG